MRLHRPSSHRTLLVPVLVLLLGLGVIATITALQGYHHASERAELRLAEVETSLNALQGAPFRASKQTGGSPAIARGLIDRGERRIDRSVADLLRSSHPPVLEELPPLLRSNYATLDRIYAIGVAGEYGRAADRLASATGIKAAAIIQRVHGARRDYAQRSATAEARATVGSAVVILLLVAAFGALYRRAHNARRTAEALGVENGRLLELSRVEALTDALTGLANRRALRRDLDAAFPAGAEPVDEVLALMDLDGFKQYNDTFGHPAGDALLARLGERLAHAVRGCGSAYRMGGDEFCVLAPLDSGHVAGFMRAVAEALSETGEAFAIGCSIGWVHTRGEATDAEGALRIADRRMYADKVGSASPTRQSTDVLLKVLSERSPDLDAHVNDVAELAESLSRANGMDDAAVHWIRLAAELHDVGKVAIPDAILDKPGPLSDEEWTFMRRHTLVGERIVGSAPSLEPAAKLVRSSHERYDGHGYPDGLRGDEIEVGASIIAICDAYDAMTKQRIYRVARSQAAAFDELRRCAGTQFDPTLVELFCATAAPRPASSALAAAPALAT
jgi:diguanylate cyclase (GGDEF)-like protein